MVSGGHTSGQTVEGTIITFTIVAGILTAMRLYTRRALNTTAVDDILIVAGLLLSILLTLTMTKQVAYGMGRHETSLTPEDGTMSLRWFWASVWIYYLALWAVKMSVLFQYLRILPENGYRKACYALMITVTVWTAWAFFSAVFACSPVNAFWDLSIKGTCLNRLGVWFANAAVNIITDICTVVLPLPVLKSLRIPRRQKYTLMFVFGLGGFTCLLSILRLQSLYVISISTDISWDNPLAATWSSLEVNVGIICSCLPTLKGFISRVYPRFTAGESHFSTISSHHDSPVVTCEAKTRDDQGFNILGNHSPDLGKSGAVPVETHELDPCCPEWDNPFEQDTAVLKAPQPALVDPARTIARENFNKSVGPRIWDVERGEFIRPGERLRTQEEKVREKVQYHAG